MGKYYDLSGQRFGRLVVLRRTAPNKSRRTRFECRCDCGNIRIMLGDNLKKGNTRSCGCLRRDANRGDEKIKKQQLELGEANKRALYGRYKRSAWARGLLFELTLDEFSILTKGNCFYCGESPNSSHSSHPHYNGIYIYNGIDRVDNSIGYTLDNSVSCCKVCNIAKHTMSSSEFLMWIGKIYDNFYVPMIIVEAGV